MFTINPEFVFSFGDELGPVDSLSTLGLFNNLLNEAGCWVKCSLRLGSPSEIIYFWNFRKKTTVEFDLGFHLFLVFYYSFTLFLIFNNYTFVGLAC